eukprot:11024482-Ditylum_brightwellii.AAC.1
MHHPTTKAANVNGAEKDATSDCEATACHAAADKAAATGYATAGYAVAAAACAQYESACSASDTGDSAGNVISSVARSAAGKCCITFPHKKQPAHY